MAGKRGRLKKPVPTRRSEFIKARKAEKAIMGAETPEEVARIIERGSPKRPPKKALTPIQDIQESLRGSSKRLRELKKIERTLELPQKPRGLMVSNDELLKRSTMGSPPFTKAELEAGYRVLKG